MESLIKHINDDTEVINNIVSQEDNDLIDIMYKLFMHYGYSVEFLIKTIFDYELYTHVITIVFRESNVYNNIIADYFKRDGGNFKLIIDYILNTAEKYNIMKSNKNLKKCAKNIIDFMDKYMQTIMSNSLIDFCDYFCVRINDIDDNKGAKILGVFVFFKLVSTQIVLSFEDAAF